MFASPPECLKLTKDQYEGRTGAQAGITFGTSPCRFLYRIHSKRYPLGHENMGIVEELGAGVTLLKTGDRVVMPFNVADGRCRNCEEGKVFNITQSLNCFTDQVKTAFCTGVNPGFAGGAYGYVAMGPYRGG